MTPLDDCGVSIDVVRQETAGATSDVSERPGVLAGPDVPIGNVRLARFSARRPLYTEEPSAYQAEFTST
jgi:hypothetical protein